MSHLSLFEFTQVVKKALEANLNPTYWVVAEIGELNLHPKGHCYLELIEKEGEQIKARMKATIWSYTYQNLIHWFEKITGTSLKEGMKIMVNAELQFHEAYGLSVNIRDIDANYTLGERQKLKQQVLARLEEEGLLTRNKDLQLPLVPQRIAVISSEHSAGYEDFSNQLQASVYRFDSTFFSAQLQGNETTRSVVDALKNIFKTIDDFDLVVILRGGGAQSDLDSFNSYLMGKAIARFPLPVITGIGHERDETIADKVANTKLKTPTAVAEFMINGMRVYEKNIDNYYERIVGSSQQIISNEKNRIHLISRQLKSGSSEKVNHSMATIKHLSLKVLTASRHLGKSQQTRIETLARQIQHSSKAHIASSSEKINGYDKLFRFSDPAFTLQRGFTYSSIGGKPLNKIKTIKPGDELKTVSSESKVISVVKEIED